MMAAEIRKMIKDSVPFLHKINPVALVTEDCTAYITTRLWIGILKSLSA